MDRLKVQDMPADLRDACLESGHSPELEMTFRDALIEWASYEIGDAAWAIDMLRLQEEFATELRAKAAP